MLEYFKKSFRRKKARRITKEYPSIINIYHLENDGPIEFANWDNPLAPPVEITQPYVDFFKRFINKGDLSLDIGANIGDTTVPMALACGSEGLTLGFDPNPFVFKILQRNASLNKGKVNIAPIPHAISENEEEFYFISSQASFTNGEISSVKESKHGKYIFPNKIKGVNLINFLETNYNDWLDKLKFIKVDTEGYDKEILKSISPLLSKYKPVIVAESFGKSTKEAKMELFEVIKQHGYDIFYFENFDVNTRTREIKTKEEMTDWKNTIDIYAIPQESDNSQVE